MAAVILYHNPGCSKCRGALEILRESGVEHRVIEYLTEPLDRQTLAHILALLPDPPSELVRKDERFDELDLDAKDYETPEAVVGLLLEHPELMQRPIAIAGNRAVIARPSEKVRNVL